MFITKSFCSIDTVIFTVFFILLTYFQNFKKCVFFMEFGIYFMRFVTFSFCTFFFNF